MLTLFAQSLMTATRMDAWEHAAKRDVESPRGERGRAPRRAFWRHWL